MKMLLLFWEAKEMSTVLSHNERGINRSVVLVQG